MNLETVKDLQSVFKSEQRTRFGIVLLKHALANNGVWPDQVDLTGVDVQDCNIIGPVYSSFSRIGLLDKCWEMHRKSQTEGSHGREIYFYRLKNYTLAETALQRLTENFKPRQAELELAAVADAPLQQEEGR